MASDRFGIMSAGKNRRGVTIVAFPVSLHATFFTLSVEYDVEIWLVSYDDLYESLHRSSHLSFPTYKLFVNILCGYAFWGTSCFTITMEAIRRQQV